LLTKYEGQSFTRDLLLEDSEFASRFGAWLKKQVGRSIQEIGETIIGDI